MNPSVVFCLLSSFLIPFNYYINGINGQLFNLNKLASNKVLKEKERLAYINPDKALEEKTSGNECFTKGDYANAIKHYSKALNHNPRDAEVFSYRAASYHLMSKFDLALNDSEECIRLDPNFVKGYIRKGYALIATKDLSKAQSAFEKALDIEFNSSEALSGWIMTFKFASTQLAITETKEQMAEKLLKLIMDLFTKIIFKCLNDAKLLILEAFFKFVLDIIKHH